MLIRIVYFHRELVPCTIIVTTLALGGILVYVKALAVRWWFAVLFTFLMVMAFPFSLVSGASVDGLT
jgi:hypothetical protein